MKGGLYIKLAAEGISKNKKLYLPYILTCICMIMMCYIIAYLSMSADLSNVRGADMLQALLSFGNFIMAIFSTIFLYYTNSFLTRRRQKEFGLYNILGMGKRNLVKILIWENILTALISVSIGLAAGILFSKAAELAAIKMLGGQTGFAIHVALKPILWSVGLFLCIYLLIMLRMLVSVWRLRPVEMLRSENVGEKPPKANWLLALMGLVILAAAYYMAVTVIDPMSSILLFFVAVVMVIVATYFLFIAGSVVLCRILQKNKKYYYKTKHFVSLSSMVYRMKRNGAGLASICILSTMVLVTVSSTVCMYAQTEKAVDERYPNDISFTMTSSDRSETAEYIETAESVLKEYGETAENISDFHLYSAAALVSGDTFTMDLSEGNDLGAEDVYESVRRLYFITLADYERISGEQRELSEDGVLLYPLKTEYDYDTMTVEGMETWNVELLDKAPYKVGSAQANMEGSLFLVVKDASVMQALQEIQNAHAEEMTRTYIKEYYGFDLSCSDEKQVEIFEEMAARMEKLVKLSKTGTLVNTSGNLPAYSMECRASGRASFIGLNGGLFFLGILLGSVFIFGTVLIMYYKQISEGYEDQERFSILQKVGMSRREIKQSINSQVLTVFFLPLLTAGVHLGFAFPLISRILILMSAVEKNYLFIITAICYLIFAAFYVAVYWITSKSYYTIVGGDKK